MGVLAIVLGGIRPPAWFCCLCSFLLFPALVYGAKNLQPADSFSQSYMKFIPSVLPISSASYVWEKNGTIPFNELILSWNAWRPQKGEYQFFIKVKHRFWSPWLKIAEWGSRGQKSFAIMDDSFVQTRYSRVIVRKGARGYAFQIKVVATGGACLRDITALSVCVSDLTKFRIRSPLKNFKTLAIDGVPLLSQLNLSHQRNGSLCSPTSTSIALNYLSPIAKKRSRLRTFTTSFADNVLDQGPLNIFGNWMLNTAQVYQASKGSVLARVQRCNSFRDLYRYLVAGIPVVVSIRGQVRGGAKSYNNGHLVVVTGWNARTQSVLCVDPAFRQSKNTLVSYRVNDFLSAWGRSCNLSYVFLKRKT